MLNRVRRWVQGAPSTVDSNLPVPVRYDKPLLSTEEQRQQDVAHRLRLAQLSERLKTLNLVQSELIRASSSDDLCRLAVEYGRSRLGLNRLSIWLLNASDPPQLQGTYGVDEHGNIRDERHKRSPMREPFDPSPTNPIDLSTKDQLEFNFQVEQDVMLVNDNLEPIGKGWLAGSRMMSADGVIGWMFVDNFLSQAPYSEDDGDIIKLYANSVGNLYRNKCIEEDLRKQQAAERDFQNRLRALSEVSIELSRLSRFDELTRRAVELGRERLGFDRLSLWFIDKTEPIATGSYGTDENGYTRDERQEKIAFTPEHLAWQARKQGDLLRVNLQSDLYDHQLHQVGAGWNAASLLWDGDQAVGWIAADNFLKRQPFTSSDQEVLTSYSVMVGYLCTRIQAEERLVKQRAEERQFQERLRALAEVNLELTKIEKFDELTRSAVELGRDRLGFDRLALFFIQPDQIHAMGSYGTDEQGETRDERYIKINVRENHLAFRAAPGEELVEVFHRELINHRGETVGDGWNAAAVLWDGKKAIGWIAVDNLLKQRPYTQMDGDILALYGTTVGHLISRKWAEQETVNMAIEKERAELMTEMVSNLSHDLRTPLSIINTSLYLLEKFEEPGQQHEKVQTIKSQTARLEKLIQDILTMSRLEAQPSYTLRPVQLNDLLSKLVEEYRPVLAQKNQSLHLELTNIASVMGLNDEMLRIFSNLMDNAINYTPAGGGITLRTHQQDQWVYAEVSDTGIGIDEEDLPRIFDRFYRADSARSSSSGGTGLGLSIVKRLTEILSADIEVESLPRHGTTFRLRFFAAMSHTTQPKSINPESTT